MTLEQRLSLVTLSVADMVRARTFYTTTLGWTPFFEMDDIVFFDMGGPCSASSSTRACRKT